MTREYMIQHWKHVVKVVLAAESQIENEWIPKFKDAKGKSSDEQARLIDEYMTTLATKIVSRWSDEQLMEMKHGQKGSEA